MPWNFPSNWFSFFVISQLCNRMCCQQHSIFSGTSLHASSFYYNIYKAYSIELTPSPSSQYTEKNSAILLTNPAFIKTISVKLTSQWWNHNRCINRTSKTLFIAWKEQKFVRGWFFFIFKQIHWQSRICHIGHPWSVVTMIVLSSET